MTKIAAYPNVYTNKLVLQKDYAFELKDVNFLIPKGEEWDGATIPRFFWRLVGGPYNPRFWRASLEHDFFCNKKIKFVPYDVAADRFYQVLIEDQVSPFKAGLMKNAVLMGGPRWGYEQYDD